MSRGIYSCCVDVIIDSQETFEEYLTEIGVDVETDSVFVSRLYQLFILKFGGYEINYTSDEPFIARVKYILAIYYEYYKQKFNLNQTIYNLTVAELNVLTVTLSNFAEAPAGEISLGEALDEITNQNTVVSKVNDLQAILSKYEALNIDIIKEFLDKFEEENIFISSYPTVVYEFSEVEVDE